MPIKSTQYWILSALLACLFAGCKKAEPGIPDLRERYTYNDTRPFGGFTAYHILTNIYPDKFVNLTDKPFASFYNNTYFDSASFYINISNAYLSSESDAKALLDFVGEGHTALISAAFFDSSLLRKLGLHQDFNPLSELFPGKRYKNTQTSLTPDEFSAQDTFSYFYRPFINAFAAVNPDNVRITGYNEYGKPNFLVCFVGRGRLYLHCEPRAFSNYFLLTANNNLYLKQIMQMMDATPGNVFWDNYYHNINFRSDEERQGLLSTVQKYPALSAAFWIIAASLLLYVLMGAKRRLRSIPVIPPVENTSIAFTEAIAGLYLTEKNNRNIAEKMIGYFNEFIRTHYYLTAQAGDSEFMMSLSKKSGVELSLVRSMYYAMQQAMDSSEVSDEELVALNAKIQEFYKTRK